MRLDANRPLGSGVIASDEWEYRGFKAIVLENSRIRTTVLPGHGAKVWEFASKRAGRDLLYHHPRFDVRPPVFGANVDDWWTGGIDEIAPTGHPCSIRGEQLPFLGEFWSQPWHYELVQSGPAAALVHLWAGGIITPLRIDRWMELREGEPILRSRHRLTNLGFETVEFMWGIHPGLAVQPGSRIQAPATEGVFEHGAGVDAPDGTTYGWPLLPLRDGSELDLTTARGPEPPAVEQHYLTGLREGWLAVTDPASGSGFAMAFDKRVLPVVWLWSVYGGWRGIYTVAFEAWTSFPGRLDKVIEAGRQRRLEPGQTLETELKFIAFEGLRSVASVSSDGRVTGGE
jgi:hypothetical protein